ncbi:MAG: hypothetical protein AB1716_02810 [Planctomycetota bacterium]
MLNSAGVEYLLLGGYAVAYYGVPRATGDMDLWFNPTGENAARLLRALREFGFSALTLTPEQLQQPGRVFRMGRPPLRIELLSSVSGLEFAEAYARRQVVRIGDVGVSLIGLDDLKANKRAAGRRRDLDDLDQMA